MGQVEADAIYYALSDGLMPNYLGGVSSQSLIKLNFGIRDIISIFVLEN